MRLIIAISLGFAFQNTVGFIREVRDKTGPAYESAQRKKDQGLIIRSILSSLALTNQ
jgi:hypothetical protein